MIEPWVFFADDTRSDPMSLMLRKFYPFTMYGVNGKYKVHAAGSPFDSVEANMLYLFFTLRRRV